MTGLRLSMESCLLLAEDFDAGWAGCAGYVE